MCCVGKRGSQPDLSASHHPYGEHNLQRQSLNLPTWIPPLHLANELSSGMSLSLETPF